MIRRVATVIASTVRSQDVAARLGGDEFAVLAVECDQPGSQELTARLRNALSAGDVSASVGIAMCQPNRPFTETWELADQDMYANKRILG